MSIDQNLNHEGSCFKVTKDSPYYECILYMREHDQNSWKMIEGVFMLGHTMQSYAIELIKNYKDSYDIQKKYNTLRG